MLPLILGTLALLWLFANVTADLQAPVQIGIICQLTPMPGVRAGCFE